eukprot:CAMPEP_0119005200 /NCGR_PEP_ID=MMETSP1176-20130426/1580_1 /TAXON_ID=265551 /ORGANISM="Synedropsis recta cf, Strain CCMP1620" /LENGTH=312 /DNA_ID=CAMNT_0006956977 /DNA_START=112 /DNA_END=1050 /DNA_ORIENTATION=-
MPSSVASAPRASDYKLENFRTNVQVQGDGLWTEIEIEENNAYVGQSVRNLINSQPGLSDADKLIIQRLAMKAFHIPGNSYWEDWVMFVRNNHILLSFFLSHPLHPFGRKERALNLVASLSFGLAATSSVTLWYYYNDKAMNETVISLFGAINISHGMITTAIFGGLCNVFFDFFIWFLQVCPLCQPGSPIADNLSDHTKFFWLWMGSNTAFIVTGVAICLALNVICIRASYEDDGDAEGYAHSIEDYSFLGSFFLEVIATQFIMFPIVAFTIFSGVLGCFTLPGLGGRPYQVNKMETRMRKQRQKESGPVEV